MNEKELLYLDGTPMSKMFPKKSEIEEITYLLKDTQRKKVKFTKPKEVIKKLNKDIYGNQNAKQTLATSLSDLEDRINLPQLDIPKSNILLFGNTGTGKTYLVNTFAKIADVPFIPIKMTGLSSVGFVGNSIEELITNGLDNYELVYKIMEEENQEKLQYSIIYLDEIDKIANRGEITFGESLQDELIGYIEDTILLESAISTKNMLFIGTGAFVGLEKIIESRLLKESSSIGFNAKLKSQLNREALLKKVTPQDLIEYGFKPELVGRFPLFSYTDSLDKESIVSIMDLPSSYLSKKRKQFKEGRQEVNLVFTKQAKYEIAQYVLDNKTNARGIQSAIDKILRPIYFSENKGATFKITPKIVKQQLYEE